MGAGKPDQATARPAGRRHFRRDGQGGSGLWELGLRLRFEARPGGGARFRDTFGHRPPLRRLRGPVVAGVRRGRQPGPLPGSEPRRSGLAEMRGGFAFPQCSGVRALLTSGAAACLCTRPRQPRERRAADGPVRSEQFPDGTGGRSWERSCRGRP